MRLFVNDEELWSASASHEARPSWLKDGQSLQDAIEERGFYPTGFFNAVDIPGIIAAKPGTEISIELLPATPTP